MSKHSRSGGKYTGNHTTLIPFAQQACDAIYNIDCLTKITPGLIKAGLKSANGNRRIKIVDKSDRCILLSIRDNASHQEVAVYVTNLQEGRAAIVQSLRNNNIAISFTKN
jgi:hypothetical protein